MDPFIGEIRAVAFALVPKDWAACNGSLVTIASNTALFSLLGTTYGGDGKTTFGLPDLRGRAIVNAGQGPGLTNYPIGTKAGTEAVALTVAQMSSHTHPFAGQFNVSTANGNSSSPSHNFLGTSPQPQYAEEGGAGTMANNIIAGTGEAAGDGQAHENRQPYLALNYLIALRGVFPSRP